MSISIISDVHIKDPNDDPYKLVLKFLNHEKVKESSVVYFLGDIFDLMCGGHAEYLKMFDDFFNAVGEIIKEGREVVYFEGNHDVILENLFKNFLKNNKLDTNKFHLEKKNIIKNYWGKKYFFSHGDELEDGNYGYKFYKNFLRSKPAKIIANKMISYKVLEYVGRKASEISRNRSSGGNYDEALVKESFRLGALKNSYDYDFIICGHSHIKDDFEFKSKSNSCRYLNNGYAPTTKSFLYINENIPEFISLD